MGLNSLPVDKKSSPEEKAKRLKRIRNLANLSRKEMCSATSGLKVNTLKGWEIGKFGGISKIGAEKVVKRLAEAGVICTVDWLLHEAGISPKVQLTKTDTETIFADSTIKLSKSKDEEHILKELLLFRQHYKNSVDMMVEDDAMAPIYKAGDYVAGIPRRQEKFFLNKVCIVVLPTAEKVLREVRPASRAGTYSLIATNPATTVPVPIIHHAQPDIIVPICWHRSRVGG